MCPEVGKYKTLVVEISFQKLGNFVNNQIHEPVIQSRIFGNNKVFIQKEYFVKPDTAL
jgi:hypothetical protein